MQLSCLFCEFIIEFLHGILPARWYGNMFRRINVFTNHMHFAVDPWVPERQAFKQLPVGLCGVNVQPVSHVCWERGPVFPGL